MWPKRSRDPGGFRDRSECLKSELTTTISRWEEAANEEEAHFYADSASSAGKYLNLLDQNAGSL